MGYRLTDFEYAALYNVTSRTIRNWKRKQAPLDSPDPNAMALFQSRERSRRGVSKNNRRSTSIKPFLQVAKPEPEPEEDDCLEQSLAELVDPILALQKQIRAEHPEIAAELMRIARITSYIFTITED
jgi:hypothetical protein